jgi:hypothetical protein
VCSTLARWQHEGELSLEHVALTVDNLRYNLNTQYQIIALVLAAMDLASQLVARHLLHAYAFTMDNRSPAAGCSPSTQSLRF